MKMTYLKLIIAILVSAFIASCVSKQNISEYSETIETSLVYEGKFGTYNVGLMFDNKPLGGLHFSSIGVYLKPHNGSFISGAPESLIDIFRYYSINEPNYYIKDEKYDGILFKNGASTGEPGFSDGVVMLCDSKEIKFIKWELYFKKISLEGDYNSYEERIIKETIEEARNEIHTWW